MRPNGTLFLMFLSVRTLSGAAFPAQEPAQSSMPVQGTTDMQAPHPKGSIPKPVDAERTILAAFDKYEVVGMSAAHGNKDLDDFVLHLIRNPAFPNKVNDVVVECGNSLHLEGAAVGRYEKDYPGVTFVIADHVGFGNWTPLEKYSHGFEARMASWPVPSLVQDMKGTWLADLLDKTHSSGNVGFGVTDGGKLPAGSVQPKGKFAAIPVEAEGKFSEMVDAYLYLGPRDLLLNEPTPAGIVLDKDYMTELQRRAAIMGGDPITDQANPPRISERDSNPFFYDPDELHKLVLRLGGNSPLPGKKN